VLKGNKKTPLNDSLELGFVDISIKEAIINIINNRKNLQS